MTEAQASCIRAAALFAADKYRRYADGLRRFDDPAVEACRESERKYRGIAANLADFDNFTPDQLNGCNVAIAATIDELNRKVQALQDRCQMQDAAVTEHRVREMYAAADVVEARLTATPATA
jgi:hypothetical protein